MKGYDIQRFLHKKYSQSQTYYYTKSLNDFVNNGRTAQVIQFYFLVHFNDRSSCMKRYYPMRKYFYNADEVIEKMKLLLEYYKYHNEIPRLFMVKLSDEMSNYHDKKRRIEYFRIKRMIEEENKKNPQKPKKGIVGDQLEETQTARTRRQQYSDVLAEMSEVSATLDQITKKLGRLQLNVGELHLLPSAREQEQLQHFLQFVQDSCRIKTGVSPPFSAKNTNTPMNFQSQRQQGETQRIPIGVNQNIIKQMISRKILSKQNTIISVSPRNNLQGNLKIQELIQSQIQGSQTQRTNNLQLNKMLSPSQSLHKSKISTMSIQQQSKAKSSYSITKQFRLSEGIKMPIKLHQHTRSEQYKLFRK